MNIKPEDLLSKPTAAAWQRIGIKPLAGVAVPLFALRSEQSTGIGDIEDLRLLIDWCASTGQKIIQLLPVNDIGDCETSPYNALSSMALDPIYISLEDLLERFPVQDKKVLKEIDKSRKTLEKEQRVAYPAVRKFKHKIYRHVFSNLPLHEQQALKDFIVENNYWLPDYAFFRALKKAFENSSWQEWPKEIDPLAYSEDILYYQFLQWVLYEQFAEIHLYANAHGVLLKGDIPILISPDSVEGWAHPDYFKPGFVAGAPPDMFSEKGQCWGFPVYDWENMAKNDYLFWRNRLKYAENFFDLYRIDHVLGFFRLWTIPQGQEADLGFFDPQIPITGSLLDQHGFSVPDLLVNKVIIPYGKEKDSFCFTWFYWQSPYFNSLPDDRKSLLKHWEKEFLYKQEGFWGNNGRTLLNVLLTASRMLPCAEDLGVVPDCVPAVLNELGIPGLRVLRWTRRWDENGQPFVPPDQIDFLSVATTSVHDCEPLLQWWQEASADERQAFWGQFLAWENSATVEIAPLSYQHLLMTIYKCNSIFVINPLQDILNWSALFPGDPKQYKVNTPGTISENNWSIRYPFSLKTLVSYTGINNFVKGSLEYRS
ncbi:MAG: 4-alpha-glucanotransferase [Candidatus Margulisiibacteriota bacterium]|jgi:4-alpha-glucanotransferase